MASPAPGEQNSSVQTGQKRKREDDDSEIQNEVKNEVKSEIKGEDAEAEADGGANVDTNTLVPNNYEPDEDDENENDSNDEDDDDENTAEDNANHPKHQESDEPFPACAYYDEAIEDVEEQLTSIAERVQALLEDHNSSSKVLVAHKRKANELSDMPPTEKMRIAILGGAGAGKSSLLNAVTGKPDLAKSLSGGQSCTCVPTEYHDSFPRQKCDFAASIKYMKPDQIREMLKETLRDYNTFAFEADEDWDEDTRTSAKKANENAFKVLLALFNNLPAFKTKPAAKAFLRDAYENATRTLLDELVQDCESKLKYTAGDDYTEYHERATLDKLRTRIDPLMTSIGTYEQPAVWPLARQVRIGVRDSRVLEKVILIDLPGITDTNQARVELTHDYIKTCDYVWVVAPISRVVDDTTVYQLLSRYGKAFRGMLSVICTHSDADIVGSERKMANHFKQEDKDVEPYNVLSDKMKAKKSEITQLNSKVTATKKRKKKATKQQMLDVREEEETLKEMRQQLAQLEAERFEFFVTTRNSLVTEQLQENMQSHVPRGQILDVHCVSNYHYAGLKGAAVNGPRLSAETTGIPKLRANTLALMAPRLMATLDHYTNFSLQAMLKDLQLWLHSASVDRRAELLELTRQPRLKLKPAFEHRLGTFANDVQNASNSTLMQAVSEASQAALKQLAKKKGKHPATIMAFIRKNGNYATKMCPKESWNENFSKFFADTVARCEASLTQARELLTAKLERGVIDDLDDFLKKIRDFPAPLPKASLVSSIETYISGIRHALRADEEEYTKEIRNILLDVSQDSNKNAFSKRIQSVYTACQEDSGNGVTKRSINRIETFLSEEGKNSAFVAVARHVTARFLHTDKSRITDKVKHKIERLMDQLYASVDGVLDNKIVDEQEAAARNDMEELLPGLLHDWEQASQSLQAVKANYETLK